jgi:two-component system cell cycle response regulator DivK
MHNNNSILIIEDNLKNMKLLRDILQVNGFNVLEAYNGKDGVKCAKNKIPSLVLLDWQLPEMGGGEVIVELKRDPNTANIPVIVVSALAMPDSVDYIRQSGCDDYITKPINVPIFLDVVKKHLLIE